MAQKKLEKGSAWEKLDTNDDGIITDDELKMKERLMRLENNDKNTDKISKFILKTAYFSI